MTAPNVIKLNLTDKTSTQSPAPLQRCARQITNVMSTPPHCGMVRSLLDTNICFEI